MNFDVWCVIGDVVPLGGDLVHGSRAKRRRAQEKRAEQPIEQTIKRTNKHVNKRRSNS